LFIWRGEGFFIARWRQSFAAKTMTKSIECFSKRKKMLNEDEQLKSEEDKDSSLEKGESRHKKLGIKQIEFGARACSCGSTVTNR